MLLNKLRKSEWRLALACLASLLTAACTDTPQIRIERVLPLDEPNLLAKVNCYDITMERIGHPTATVHAFSSDVAFDFNNVAAGRWQMTIRGMIRRQVLNASGKLDFAPCDANQQEVVLGQTQPFAVAPGKSGVVRVALGRTGAFNRYAIASLDNGPSPLSGLIEHSATAFADQNGKAWILVAGGRKGYTGAPLTTSSLIDVGNLTVARLETGLSCARAAHFAVSVKGQDGVTRIALAGGDGNCGQSVDIFDTATTTFSTIDLKGGPIAGLVNVLAARPDWDGTFAATGRLLALNDAPCAFDPAAPQECEPWQGDLPALRAGNDQLPFAATTLLAIDGDRSLAIGGQQWALLRMSADRIVEVTEGQMALGANLTGFAAFPSSDAGRPAVLLTGGWLNGSPSQSVALFGIGDDNQAPAWFGLDADSERDTNSEPAATKLQLGQPRAGHAAVALPNGSSWLIGGEAQGSVEVFVPLGKNTAPVAWPLAERRPRITSIAVYDSKPENQAFSSAFTEKYVDMLFKGANQAPSGIVMALASAYRGVGDQTLTSRLTDPLNEIEGSERWRGCGFLEVSKPSPIEGVVSYGVEDSPWENIGNKEDAKIAVMKVADKICSEPFISFGINHALNASDFAGQRSKLLLNPSTPAPSEAPLSCPWQQFLRVGFDSLPDREIKTAFAGVNVLSFIVSNDDCSQGLYSLLPSEPTPSLSEDEARKLSDAVISLQTCGAKELDDFIGFDLKKDSNGDDVSDFADKLASLTHDNKDLIIAFINVQHDTVKPCAGKSPLQLEDTRPPRLIKTADAISFLGAEVRWFDVCVQADKEPPSINLSEFTTAIASRNRLQVCLPAGISIKADSPPQVSKTGAGTLFKPIGKGDSNTIAFELANRCHVLKIEQQNPYILDTTPARSRVSIVPRDRWRIGTDTDGKAGCTNGWLIELVPDSPLNTDSLLRAAYDAGQIELWLTCSPTAIAAARSGETF